MFCGRLFRSCLFVGYLVVIAMRSCGWFCFRVVDAYYVGFWGVLVLFVWHGGLLRWADWLMVSLFGWVLVFGV